MTRIGFSGLAAAGFAAVMSFGSGFSSEAEAAVLQSCKGNAFNTTVSCCEGIRRKTMIILHYGNINCSRDVDCKIKKGKKSCYVEVTRRDPNDTPDTPKDTPDTPKDTPNDTPNTPNDHDTSVPK